MTGFLTTATRTALSRQPENALTDCLAASFRVSPTVRKVVMDRLWKGHGVTVECPQLDSWLCETQRSGDYEGERGVLDLLVRLDPAKRAPEYVGPRDLVVECKVDAVLTKQQLLKYARRHQYVAVLTKHYPDEPSAWLRDNRIVCVRWQEIHKDLDNARPVNPVDRFVVRSLVELLEEVRVAYRDVTMTDIEALASTLRSISGVQDSGVSGSLRFDVADQLIAQLDDVKRSLLDALSDRGFLRGRGPGYSNEVDEETSREKNHLMGFRLLPSQQADKWLDVYLVISQSRREPITWRVYGWDWEKDDYLSPPLDSPVESMLVDGCFSTKLLGDHVVEYVQKASLSV